MEVMMMGLTTCSSTLGIHSVSMRPKLEDLELSDDPARYTGPSFEELDEKMRDVFHSFLEERGVNESLFPFLQALLYVKDHRKFAICCGGSNQLALIFSVCWKVIVKKTFLRKVMMMMIWRKSMRRKFIQKQSLR
ncbi:hypothetical protein YC2023_000568 [Brassica napus]